MRNDKENLIVKKTFDFSLQIIEYCEELRALNKYEMASQLFKSGASIGANTWVAQNGESSADFVHKFKITAKEADETLYWIELCQASSYYPNPQEAVFSELKSLIRIISKIIGTSKRAKLSN
ncbi:four helix bundle protein [Arenibacter sp. BSSL-BM3]|uniref:Four helix bundle protein n=1 Tax=Arenibacter arenosicollis TaxID=2762274 RepID=A0ABR7QJ67_9FLAO|nr:four helix bundle protein [Arenibacter arenosicollis]MBC8766980.1 four helix bundle protein [Arenibacter arenosicollis]